MALHLSLTVKEFPPKKTIKREIDLVGEKLPSFIRKLRPQLALTIVQQVIFCV
jgi:hypothetical protein